MSKPHISAVLSDADKTTIKTNIANARLLMPWLVNLTNEERRKMRKTGSKREGYVQDVYNTSIANSGALPADFELAEWTKDEVLIKQAIDIRETLSSFMEAIDDTVLLLGAERIHNADIAYGHLKQSAKNNSSITGDIERIARQFEGMGHRKNATKYTIAPGSKIEVSNVVPGTLIVNDGETVLRYKGGSDLANVVKMPPVNINPGNSGLIPEKCTIIEVENISVDVTGAFNVISR